MKTKVQTPNQTGRLLTLAAALVALAVLPARAQTTEEFKQLKTIVEQMQKTIDAQNARIAELEKSRAGQPATNPPAAVAPVATAAASPPVRTLDKVAAGQDAGSPSPVTYRDAMNDHQTGAPRPGSQTLDTKYTGFFPIPNTSVIVKVNAKPRVDFTDDNRNSGDPDRFAPAQIPTQGTPAYGGGNQFDVSARGSQLSLDVRAPDIEGAPRFYYEMDFFGGGATGGMTPRVRQLYGQFHNLIAGYSYSVFEDPDAWPDTVDYEGPNSAVFARQPEIRYQLPLNDQWHLNFGLQQPCTDLDPGTYANAAAVNHAPDGGFNVRWEDPRVGHVQFGTLFRALGANDPVAGDQTVFGWGMNLAGSLNVWAKDTMQFQATYGHGIFHYINDNFVNNDVAYDNRGHLTALPFLGLMGGYTHRWSDRFRSTATFGYNNLNNEPTQGALAYHETYYSSLNVIYQLRKRLTIGLEGLYGRKEVQDGTSGDVFRIQLSLVYSLFPPGMQ